MGWYAFKQWLEISGGLDMDALHVHAGVACQLLAALLFRRPVKSLLPWFAVLIAAMANEWYDLLLETWPDRDTQWLESVKDVANTILLPTVLLVIAKWAPRLLVGAAPLTPVPESSEP